MLPGFRTMKSLGFLIKAPFILVVLFVINLVTSPGEWWVQWAALGIGIAWFFALLRVIRGVILAGGLVALGLYLFNRYNRPAATPASGPGSTQPPDIPTVPVARG